MNYYRNGNGVLATINTMPLTEITEEEYTSTLERAKKSHAAREEVYNRHRPLTESEVLTMLLKQQVNTLEVDDQTACRMKAFYPVWKAGIAYSAGYKAQHSGRLWRCRQAHTSQEEWEPENVPALWEEICETHDGSLYDPIPYEGSMALENGKYYSQDGVTYLCSRDTGNPVYHALRELVGIYVEPLA